MSTTTQPKRTFEQYLTYDDGTDNRYELVRGLVLLMNPHKEKLEGSQRIISATFPELNLTADQILRGKL